MKPLDDNQLWAFLDRELPPEEREAMKRRIESDPALREESEQRMACDSRLRQELSSLRVDHQLLRDSILQEIEFVPSPAEELGNSRQYWLLAASIALLLLPLLYIGQWTRRSPYNSGKPIIKNEPKQREGIAKVRTQIGDVFARYSTYTAWSKMKGEEVAKGDSIRSYPKGFAEIEMHKAVLRMDENTDLAITGGRSLTLRRGRIWLNVLPSDEKFQVTTPQATVLVLGCKLFVSADDLTCAVAVQHDIVAVKSNNLKSTLVMEGEQISLGGYSQGIQAADLFEWRKWMKPFLRGEEADSWAAMEKTVSELEKIKDANPWGCPSVDKPAAPIALHFLLRKGGSEIFRNFLSQSLADPEPWDTELAPAILSLMEKETDNESLAHCYSGMQILLMANDLPESGSRTFNSWETQIIELKSRWQESKEYRATRHGYDSSW